jgi:hypothetical protein
MIPRYLLDEPPLLVLPSLARLIGLNEAIVLQQVHYWVVNARESKRVSNFRQERWWVYHSYPEWAETFPFWSEPTIIRTFRNLEKEGLVLSDCLGDDPRDRRKWYTIDYEALGQRIARGTRSDCAGPSDQSDQMDQITLIASMGSNRSDGSDLIDPVHRINQIRSYKGAETPTQTNTETTTDTSPGHGNATTASAEPKEKAVVASLADSLCACGVTRSVAEALAQQCDPQRIERHIAQLPFRKANDPAAVLVKAIQEDWAAPAAFEVAQQEQAKKARQAERRRRQQESQAAQRSEKAAQQERLDAFFASLDEATRRNIETRAEARFQSERPDMARRSIKPVRESYLAEYRTDILTAMLPPAPDGGQTP